MNFVLVAVVATNFRLVVVVYNFIIIETDCSCHTGFFANTSNNLFVSCSPDSSYSNTMVFSK